MSQEFGRPVRVPSGRLTRATRLGSVAAGVAGRALLSGAAELGRGRRPAARDLLLTPANLRRIADELARMRGAAMKMGQLLSMEASDLIPAELAEVMARLRGQADFMPPSQLRAVLTREWGRDWLGAFRGFDPRPIAAASIGQVHRATLRDGRDVAVKVQYPGVARSIDSDVANVGALLRMSGLLPSGFVLDPYLAEARAQLHQETDYRAEAAHLAAFKDLLADDPRFDLPEVVTNLSTAQVMTMSLVAGGPVEAAAAAGQEVRDRLATDLLDLSLRELLDFGLMQTDPNFANFRFDPGTGRIGLLDFGATRPIGVSVARTYRMLLQSGLDGDLGGIDAGLIDLGLLTGTEELAHRTAILGMAERAIAAIGPDQPHDFGDKTLANDLQSRGMALARDGYVPPPLPMDVLFVQRKLAGMALLAARLGARVDLRALLIARLA